jgi:hypothetical protein
VSGYFSTGGGGGAGFWLIAADPADLTATINDAALDDGATCDVAAPLDTFHLDKGCTLAIDGIGVVATLSGAGRWIRRYQPPIQDTGPLPSYAAQGVGAAVVVSLPWPNSTAGQVALSIAGLCTAGGDAGSAMCFGCVFGVKKGIGAGTIALVGAPAYDPRRDAPFVALVVAVAVNVGTGKIDVTLPGLAGDTIDWSFTVQLGKVPR